ncbi:MAG TPA: hypothetical protein VFO31_02650, partial [Vicinamibacterales bacterium]|nr:hypothetical protein [Vicinamibacterales bacterium]
IKRLVFSEGLTLAGARRKLEESAPRTAADVDHDVAEVLDALASDARTRIAYVRDGLRSILQLLSNAPGTVVVVDDQRTGNGPARSVRPAPASVRRMPQRKDKKPARAVRSAAGSASRAKPATMKAAAKAAGKSKRRASA